MDKMGFVHHLQALDLVLLWSICADLFLILPSYFKTSSTSPHALHSAMQLGTGKFSHPQLESLAEDYALRYDIGVRC